MAALVSGAYKDEAMRVMAAAWLGAVRQLFDDGRPGRLNWRPAWAAIAVMLSRMDAVAIIERR